MAPSKLASGEFSNPLVLIFCDIQIYDFLPLMFGCDHDSNSRCKCGNCDVEYLQNPSECYVLLQRVGRMCGSLESKINLQHVTHDDVLTCITSHLASTLYLSRNGVLDWLLENAVPKGIKVSTNRIKGKVSY